MSQSEFFLLLAKGIGKLANCTNEELSYYLDESQLPVPTMQRIVDAISLQHRRETFTLTPLPLCADPQLRESHSTRLHRLGADPDIIRQGDPSVEFPVFLEQSLPTGTTHWKNLVKE
jgi:hypothetical protein